MSKATAKLNRKPIPFDQLPDCAWVRKPTLMALFSVSDTTLWRWGREGRIPKPTLIGPRVSAWRVGDIRRFLEQQS